MDIQFFHGNPIFTVACVVPVKDELLDITAFGNKDLLIPVGLSRVNPIDQYCKATGRSISESRLESYKYTLFDMSYPDEDSIILNFYSHTSPVWKLSFRVHRKSDRPHFIESILA